MFVIQRELHDLLDPTTSARLRIRSFEDVPTVDGLTKEFCGSRDEAVKLVQRAYANRPDARRRMVDQSHVVIAFELLQKVRVSDLHEFISRRIGRNVCWSLSLGRREKTTRERHLCHGNCEKGAFHFLMIVHPRVRDPIFRNLLPGAHFCERVLMDWEDSFFAFNF